MTSSKIEIPGEVKSDPAALMASLQLMPSPVPNPELKYTKVRFFSALCAHFRLFFPQCGARRLHATAQKSVKTSLSLGVSSHGSSNPNGKLSLKLEKVYRLWIYFISCSHVFGDYQLKKKNTSQFSKVSKTFRLNRFH